VNAPEQELRCERAERAERLTEYVCGTLPRTAAIEIEAHAAECAVCRRELEELGPVVDAFDAWPRDVLRPPPSLQERLALRIATETGEKPVLPPASDWKEPEWEEVTPGIFCKLLATDTERDRVTMLVRLLPGVSYPPHTHAGVEQLHLLSGELWIEDRLLRAGDYNYGAPGASDQRVYSETGCTCVLITSPSDVLL
jgi:anti-sigma factor ChrR (cupin superfamily)